MEGHRHATSTEGGQTKENAIKRNTDEAPPIQQFCSNNSRGVARRRFTEDPKKNSKDYPQER
jgi:hypothetical protein